MIRGQEEKMPTIKLPMHSYILSNYGFTMSTVISPLAFICNTTM